MGRDWPIVGGRLDESIKYSGRKLVFLVVGVRHRKEPSTLFRCAPDLGMRVATLARMAR